MLEPVIWTVPEDLPCFEGHFPGMPVLPAVVMLDVSCEFLRNALSRPGLRLATVSSAKFTGPVTPGMRVRIAFQEKEGEWEVEWETVGPPSRPLARIKLGIRM